MPAGEPHILIDATAIPADRGGVGRYVDALVAALAEAGAHLSVVCKPVDGPLFAAIAPGIDLITPSDRLARREMRLAWEQTGLPRLANRLGVDVLHSPHYTLPLLPSVARSSVARSSTAKVVTLHDATFFTDPEVHTPGKRRFFQSWTKTAMNRADGCIVPSQATASELQRVVGEPKHPFTVAWHGVDTTQFHPPSEAERAAAHRLLSLDGEPYVAFLGTLEPRKNVPALIAGFGQAVHQRATPPTLVLAGQRGWDDRIKAAIAALPSGVRVIEAGYLPVDALAGFLGGAAVVAYPSLGEGFGLPVLEAMACGACVLTTRRLSLPEVGGDAVAYCDVTSESIGSQLGTLLDDQPRRAALGVAARKRAAEFTWARSAQQHMDAYQAALGNHQKSG